MTFSEDETLKQLIRLNTGALKTISGVWPSAQKVLPQLKDVARNIFSSQKSAAEKGFWDTFADDEMRNLVEDENISGFQLT
jgi:hypothetical protein